MTVVLAYYNYLDDWQDDHKRSRLRLAKQLEPHLENIRRQWPRQCEAIHTKLDELNRLESANSTDLDALCNAFGALLGAVARSLPGKRIFGQKNFGVWAFTLENSSI